MTSILDRPLKARTLAKLSPRRRVTNGLATVAVSLSLLIALAPLLWVLYSVVAKGFKAITSGLWWTHSQAGLGPLDAGGGAYHAILGTLLEGLICAAISVPIGILIAVYLVEYGRGTLRARLASFMIDILSGVPAIVAALFIYALFVATLGLRRSLFAAASALVLLMLPVIVRATEEMLLIVPADLREASYALGVPKWKTIVRVVIPTGLPGIVTGILLALARVVGETAPLLILVGYSQAIHLNVFRGSMGTLPGMMYDQTSAGAGINPVPTERMWGAALTLIALVAVINIGARMVSMFFAQKNR